MLGLTVGCYLTISLVILEGLKMKRRKPLSAIILLIILAILALIFLASCRNQDENKNFSEYEQKLKGLSQKNTPKARLILFMSIDQSVLVWVLEETIEPVLEKNELLFTKKDLAEIKDNLDKARKTLTEMRSNLVGFIELYDEITFEGVKRYFEEDFYPEYPKILSIFEKVGDKIEKVVNKRPKISRTI